jgi:cell wall-associated NlpC family hydrolase
VVTAQAGTAAAVGVLAVVVLPLALLTALISLLWSAITPTTPGAAAGTGAGGSPVAVADIPGDYLALYVAAARTCPGLDWSVLAAVGKIETDHGRSTLPGVRSGANASGSVGIMQFQPATWAAVTAQHPVPPGGATPPSPYNPHDAIYTAAAYLCSGGAGNPATLNEAIFSYNHSNQYVADVLAQAHRYTASASATTGRDQAGTAPQSANSGSGSGVAAAAITYARGQIGRPYVWGGNGETGFDCSGLTKAAYGAAGVTLPRTADQQFRAGPRLPANEPLQPGDLVFYGGPIITHVALYVGGNQVIQAKDIGTLIEQDALPTSNYAGATRPTAITTVTPSGSSFLAGPEAHIGNLVVFYQRFRTLISGCLLYLAERYYTALSIVGLVANSVAFCHGGPSCGSHGPESRRVCCLGSARRVWSRVHLGCVAPSSRCMAAGLPRRGGQLGHGR